MTAPRSAAPTQQDHAEAFRVEAAVSALHGGQKFNEDAEGCIARAIAIARREGFRAGIESAAKLADNFGTPSFMAGDTYSESRAGVFYAKRVLSEEIRALSRAGSESGQPGASVSPGGEDATGGGA